ncbi:MAG: glycosyltransferase family 4 protein [Patescibacteria group bacterium]|nr:glycosyltransferase family 4 protein [Patescibacteria group bacterium]
MKFLLFTLEYFPFKGGISNYYTNLSYYWPKSSQLFILNNNNNELLYRRGIFKWRPAIFKLYHFIKKNKIDHVIVGHILPLGIAVLIVSKLLKFKYSVVLHGMDLTYATRNRRKRFISRLILKRADKIISANSYTAVLCSNFLRSGQKIIVVNPGAKDFSDFNEERNIEIRVKNNLNGHKILFSLGRLVRRKGFDMVILAIKKILQDQPDYDLIYLVAGKGPDEKYLKNLAEKELGANWSKYIKLIGEISEGEKWSLFSLCDVFIMPSRNIAGDFEGFGIVYIEANLAGKAVIAGNSGGIPDAVENNVNGILVDPENIDDIAGAILKLLDNEELRKKIGERGRNRVLNDFNWRDKVSDIYNFLNK